MRSTGSGSSTGANRESFEKEQNILSGPGVTVLVVGQVMGLVVDMLEPLVLLDEV